MKDRFFSCMFMMILFAASAACSPPVPGGNNESGSTLTFTRRAIVDRQGFGYEVFSILVPRKWSFQGQVNWKFPGGIPQPVLTWRVNSPDGRAHVQQYPDMNFQWSNNPMMLQTYRVNGASVAQPVPAADFLTRMFLPSIRGGASARVIKRTELPELARYWKTVQEQLLLQVYNPISPLPARPVMDAEAALIEIQSDGGTSASREQYMVIINRAYMAVPSMYGPIQTVAWNAVVTSFVAPASNKKELSVPFSVMMHSAKLSPRWGVDCTRLTATCARNMLRQQQAIFNQMQQISRSQSEVSDMIMDGWEKRNKVMDGVYDRFSDYMRGTERYHDPIQDMTVDIPNTYENAWTNGLDYVVSENPNFNPNLTADTRNWTRMTPVR